MNRLQLRTAIKAVRAKPSAGPALQTAKPRSFKTAVAVAAPAYLEPHLSAPSPTSPPDTSPIYSSPLSTTSPLAAKPGYTEPHLSVTVPPDPAAVSPALLSPNSLPQRALTHMAPGLARMAARKPHPTVVTKPPSAEPMPPADDHTALYVLGGLALAAVILLR